MARWRILVLAILVIGAGAVAFGIWHGRQGGTPTAESGSSSGNSSDTAPTPVSGTAANRAKPAAEAGTMFFTGLKLDTSASAPQACLTFSRRLSTAPTTHYEDFVRIDPAAKVSLQPNGNRLCIGGLSFEKHYSVTIAKGLPSENGPASLTPETVPVSFGEMPAHVGFADSGFILSRDQVRGMPIETVNVDKVKVTVERIGDRILARTELGRSYQDREGEYDEETGKSVSTIAVPVWSGVLSVKKRLNERVITGFPIADVLTPRKPGAYSVTIERVKAPGESEARSRDDYMDQEQRQRWIFDTDLMITSFAGQDGLHVFVRSLKTAKPVSGAEVSLIATNNDELGRGKSDGDGQVVFNAGLTRGKAALSPRMLMAYLGDDFSAIELNKPALDLSDQGIDGREEASAVDAFLYTDRGIYRPGETIDVTGMVRDRIGKAAKPTPIALVLKRPDGVEAGHWRLDPNEVGGIVQQIQLSPTAPRGGWHLEATLAGDKAVIGQADIQVQDFVPQRLKVALTTDAKVLLPDAPATIKIDARYLFGAPAAGLAAEGHLTFEPNPSPVPEKGWHFGLADDRLQSEPQDLTIAAMDADGKGEAVLDPTKLKMPETSLPLKATIDIAVVEPGGRTTDNQVQLPVQLTPVLLGLRPTASNNQVGEGEKARIEVALFQPDGQKIARQRLDYRVVALIDNYNYYSDGGRWEWKRVTRERPVLEGSIALTGDRPGVIETPPLEWGRYRIDAMDPETHVVSSVMVHAGWLVSSEENPAPEKVSLALDGGPVKAGGTAHIKIKPPFAGEVLLTVASSRVFQTKTVSVPAEGKTVDIEASADWGPGAYVIANLYRPQSAAEGHAPLRAVGVAWVPLDMQDRTLNVAIGAPAVARPRGKLDVPIAVTGAGSGEAVYVTLAAVDEGILQLTKFKSPDPNSYYFGKRRLAVDIRDDYAHLIDGNEGETGEIRQGGDAGGAGLSVVPTKTVALFSGLVKLDSSGKAVIPLDLPDFNGGLRLMAVAFGTSGMGHADMMMPVRDPVVAEISLPRFLAPKDDARMTLLVNNVEGAAGSYHIHIAASGAVTAPAVDEDMTLAAAQQKIETFPISGGDPGIGTVALTLTGPDKLKIDHSWPIQVRPAHFPLTLATVATQQPGEGYTVDPAVLKAFLPGTGKVTIGYSTLRGIDLPGLVEALNRYPYGCSEQLTSEAMPLVYLEDLKLASGKVAPDDEHMRVQTAINQLLEREDSDGSFGLWRLGDRLATPYLGAYIVDFLARAKTKGYAVPDEALERAYKGMDHYENGGSWRTVVFWLPLDTKSRNDPVVAGKAYADYVLARVKRADISELRYLHDTEFERMEPAAKAQLGAALALMGDKARSEHLLSAAEREVTNQPRIWNWAGDYYRSPIRDIALMLTLMTEIGDNARVARLSAKLEEQENRTDYLTTQEQAWLSVAAATLLSKGGPIALSVNHAAVSPTPPPVTLRPDEKAITAGYAIENKGQAQVFRTVTQYGVPTVAPSAMANGVTITKTVTAMDGSPVDLSAIKQNQRLMVHLSGKSGDHAYHQAILVDMLPAGWELEAVVPPKRHDADNGFPWLGGISPTKSSQKRDDRFVAAFDLGGEQPRGGDDDEDEDKTDPESFNLAYVVRSVTPGHFTLPAAVVQDMYRPPVMARTDVGAVSIAGK
ncbi:MAG TPA: alpha-2-macroglobulin [Alphaproteobacteria bacterium]|nr:alpha-2-macroglobulin [Alphaproteobacteria bacterium]